MKALIAASLIFAMPSTASAADQITKAPIAIHNWTGFYIGGHVARTWARTEGSNDFFGADISQQLRGWLGGGQVGVNHQIGRIVLGAELSGSIGNASGISSCLNSQFLPGHIISCAAKQDWVAHLLGRIGYAPGDGRFLPYILGGVSFTHLQSTKQISPPPGAPLGVTLWTVSWGRANEHAGATVGAGAQYAVLPNLSVGIDYLYTIFGVADHGSQAIYTQSFNANSFTGPARFDSPQDLKSHAARFILNYKFD